MSPSISELKKRINLCEEYKKEVYNNIGRIRNAEEWIEYYNKYIDDYNSEIKRKKILTAAATAIPFAIAFGVLIPAPVWYSHLWLPLLASKL